MHLSFILLALSTLAAAGPLPPSSNTTLEAGPAHPILANITLTIDPTAAMNKLKTIYDHLNQTDHDAISTVKSDFWKWLQDTVEAPGGLHSRSPDSSSMPANSTLDCDSITELTKLKAIYDSRRNETDHDHDDASLKVKRGFWTWLKDAFEAPGMGVDHVTVGR